MSSNKDHETYVRDLEAAIKEVDDSWQAYQGWKGSDEVRQRWIRALDALRSGEVHHVLGCLARPVGEPHGR